MMERRKSLKLMSGFAPIIFLPTNNIIISKKFDSSQLLRMFSLRMKSIETYCYELFKSMPLSDFNFQPTSESMSFGKLFTHIGNGLEVYAGVLDGSSLDKEPDSSNNNVVLAYLENGFSHFSEALNQQNEKDIFSIKHQYPDKAPWKEFSIAEILMLAYSHTTHHNAQAALYLRLKDITPPKYRF
jgi:uncharacterized damage-inducible protein DinB